MPDLIFKVVERTEWEQAVAAGCYTGSSDDIRDGFIHLSTLEQLQGTLDKHFTDKENLLLIGFRSDDFGTELKWESSRNNALFPHLYGGLNIEKAVYSAVLTRDTDGRYQVPDSETG